jgi:glyoxylase-like metal-dependent hydrolase (beta-lactamase superfamily II)
MTLDGTNTWVIGDPERAAPVVVDPGPLDDRHLAAVFDACRGRVAVIVLTHRHADHSAGAARLAAQAGCGVRAADPDFRLGPDGLADGDLIPVAGSTLRVLATPGHTRDSCSLLLEGADGARLLTGDTVLGRGTSVIARGAGDQADGDLGAYLASLERLEALVVEAGVREILPGHGPRVGDPAAWLAGYLAHRRERLNQVRAAVAAGDRTAGEVVDRVYADVDPGLWPAAEQSVAAQLDYLGLDPGRPR